MVSSDSPAASLVVTVLVLAYVLYQQLQVRPVTGRILLPIILIVLGGSSVASYSHQHPLSHSAVAALAGVLILDAGALGALRACTVRLWRDGGRVMRQGTWFTIALWLAGLAIHIAVDQTVHLASSSLLLYLGITYLIQRLVLLSRARAADPA